MSLTLRQRRALEMARQCAGEHTVGERICYCVRPMGHDGAHRDYKGREFAALFPWVGRWARHQAMRQQRAKARA